MQAVKYDGPAPHAVADRHRRRGLQQMLGLAALGMSGCASRGPEPKALASAIAPFSTAPVGSTAPAGWVPYVMRRDRPITEYTVVAGADRPVLHARSSAAASGLRCPVHIDPRAQGLLRFSWRVQQLHESATVDAPESDDAATRVIVAFGGDDARLSLRDRLLFDQVELFTGQRLPFATLMYVWDGALRPETVVHNHRTARIRYLTIETGRRRTGQWLHYERDVAADYQRVFGEAPGPITSVGVLTDSDALKHEQQAWYGDISLSQRRTG
ncbi:MAG: DUF3047 domain-containing protein [Burkholderiales bacterium]|nr:DUF3047 domain-containing protein [Burkholderiales bacterium]